MPLFVAALIGGLIQAAGSMVGRVLLSLGIGYVTYSGVSVVLASLKSQVVNSFSGLPAIAIQVVSLMKVDVCLNILFSALAARLVIRGLTSDRVTRMVLK